MSETATAQPKAEPKKDWVNILFITFTPVIAGPVLAWYTYQNGFHWWMFALFAVMYALTGLSICAGYHRFYSHKSYECSPLVQMGYAIFGAMATQNSILKWSSGHRRHHSYAEEEWDPYSIKRGFWWAHFIWIFYVDPYSDRLDNVRDLQKNPIVLWQHRWYTAIVIVAGLGVPALIGWFMGDAIAGLLWGGFLRIVTVHHSTFFVNSLAHHMGSQEYDDEATARDNGVVALLTFGEGYHSFHHKFPSDFRNGIRWYYWDPAKWMIRGLQMVGLTSNLLVTAAPMIERARMNTALKRLDAKITAAEKVHGADIRARIESARESFDSALALWRKQAELRREGISEQWRETHRNYRECLKRARQEWRTVLQVVETA